MTSESMFEEFRRKGMSVEEAFYNAYNPSDLESMQKFSEVKGDNSVPLTFVDGKAKLSSPHLCEWFISNYSVLYSDDDWKNRHFLVNGEKYTDVQLMNFIQGKLPNYYYSHKDVFTFIREAVELLKVKCATTEKKKLKANKIDWSDEEIFNLKFYVDELIAEGDLSLFYGKSGVGKTTALLKMAEMMATGKEMFYQSTTPCKVAYIDFENHPFKFKKALSLMGVSLPPHFDVFSAESGQFSAAEMVDLLEDFRGYNVVILDNLWCFTESSPYEASEIVRYCKELKTGAEHLKLHLIIAHHSSKGNYGSGSNKASSDNASGSAQLINTFSTCFEARKEADTYYTAITKSRYGSGVDGICFDFKGEEVILNPASRNLEAVNKERQENSERIRSEILEAFEQLKKEGKLSELTTGKVNELIASKVNCGEKKVQRTLQIKEDKINVKGKWYYKE